MAGDERSLVEIEDVQHTLEDAPVRSNLAPDPAAVLTPPPREA
jgi:hypothetical protein